MDPIYRMLLEALANGAPEPTKGIALATIARLDKQLTDNAADLLAQNVTISATPGPVINLFDVPDSVAVEADVWRALFIALGLDPDVNDAEDLGAAAIDLQAMNAAQAETLTQLRGLVGESQSSLVEMVRSLVERNDVQAQTIQRMRGERDQARKDVEEWRSLAEAKADDAATSLHTSAVAAGTTIPPAAIVIEDFEPIAPAPRPAVSPDAFSGGVDREIQHQEAERKGRVGELIAAVGPMPEDVADRAEVQVGPLCEILADLLDGKPGTARQRAGALLKEDGRAGVVARLGAWVNDHFRNAAGLKRPEDLREYRAAFTAAIADAKKAASLRRNAKPQKEAA